MMSKDTKVLKDDDTVEPGKASAHTAAPNPSADAAEPTDLTPEEVEALRTEAAKAGEHWERYVRTAADLENFRKRAARERQEAVRYANEGLLTKLIPVLDSFDMALAATHETEPTADGAVREGVQMIRNQLQGALKEAGLEEVNAENQMFDPAWHEAVSTLPSPEVEEGRVLQQLRKGYRLHDRLLRPASVVVARAPSAPDA